MKKNTLLIIIVVVTLVTVIGIATYAYFATGLMNITNVANINAVTEQNNMVFDTLGGGMSLNITTANMVEAKQGNVAAENNTTLTVNFTPNTDYSMVCTYDIVYEWTSTDKYTTHSPGVTDNEFTIQAFQTPTENTANGNSIVTEETDLSALTYTNNSVTIVSGAKISGTGNTTTTAVWNLISRVYNVNASQTALEGKNFAGKFKIANVSCVEGEVEIIIASGDVNASITWTLNNKGTLKIMGSGAMPNYDSSAEEPWYEYRNSIERAKIDNGITSIGRTNFGGLTKLKSVNIPSSVTTIGAGAFVSSGLTSITIPDTVTSIGQSVFQNCESLTNVTLSNNINFIPEGAFYYCSSLTSITIPSSVTRIGDYAFRYSGLTSITIPNSVNNISTNVFENSNNLTSVTLPNSIRTIPDYTFNGCSSLTTVNFPNNLTTIGNYAFQGTGLTSIAIPSSVTTIGDYAFSKSDLTSITVPNTVSSLGYAAFYKCTDLTTATLPQNPAIKTIPDSIFDGCSSLTSVTIPNTITSIGGRAFAKTGLTSITIPSSVTTIYDYAFSESSLTSITIPDTVTTLGGYAFLRCTNLTTAILSSNVRIINAYMFYGCSSLTSVTIPNTVTGIDARAFENSGLTSISYNGNLYTTVSGFTSAYGGTLGSNVFTGTSLGA